MLAFLSCLSPAVCVAHVSLPIATDQYDSQETPARAEIDELAAAVAKDSGNVALRRDLAMKLIDAHDWSGAIRQYNALIAIAPDVPEFYFARGTAYERLEEATKPGADLGVYTNVTMARADFTVYTHLKPADPVGWNNLGKCLLQGTNYNGAIAALTKCISLKPAEPVLVEAYRNRGVAHFSNEEPTDAESDLAVYRKARPSGVAELNAELSRVLFGPNRHPMASFQRAVEDPAGRKDPNTWFNLGIGYLGYRENEKAIAAFTKSYELKADPQTLFNRALAYYNIGQAGNTSGYAKAEADTTAALSMKPEYRDATILRADAERFEKKGEAAVADYTRFISMVGISQSDKFYAEVMSLFAVENYKAAIPFLLKYQAEKTPNGGNAYAWLAEAYTQTGDYARAAEAYGKTEPQSGSDQIAVAAADAYMQLGDIATTAGVERAAAYAKAVALYERACQVLPYYSGGSAAPILYKEASALEAEAGVTQSEAPLKAAITVWGRWESQSLSDPELPKVKRHALELLMKVGNAD